MTSLVCLHGTGDTYLVCALAEAFKQQYGRTELVVKSKHVAIPRLFGYRCTVDDALVHRGETDSEFQATWLNDIGGNVFVHPSFVRTPARIDALTAKPTVTQADMYRALLRLSPEVPLDVPPAVEATLVRNRVLFIPETRSWPNASPIFWEQLATALDGLGWQVTWNDPALSLEELLAKCAEAEWVIGPQCGVMAIICAARFPCRKTFVTSTTLPDWYANTVFPYAYVSTFTGHDYDVEEHSLTAGREPEIVAAIANGANARRLWPHDPQPTKTIQAPLTPGEFLDRFAILEVKRERFTSTKSAGIEREYLRYRVLFQKYFTERAVGYLDELIKLHTENFDILEKMVPDALELGAIETDHHIAAMRSNQARVAVKQAVNAFCNSSYQEVKSYYNEGSRSRSYRVDGR